MGLPGPAEGIRLDRGLTYLSAASFSNLHGIHPCAGANVYMYELKGAVSRLRGRISDMMVRL